MRRKSYRGSMHRRGNRRKEGLGRADLKRARQHKTTLKRDLAAMTEVWRMIKEGTIRAFGEIGRQY